MLLYHNGTNSIIENSTGNFEILANEFRVKSKTGGEAHIQSSDEGGVNLYWDNNVRFATTDDGADVSGTASLKIPVGTTAQRNSSPADGDIRYNSTLNSYEGYGNSAWGGLGGGTEIDTSVSSTSATSITTFAHASYRSASIRIQIVQGSAYQVGRYLLIHDGTTVTLIEESAIATGSMLGTITAAIVSTNVVVYVNMGSSSSATVTTIIDKITV
jgi:hydrogenase maturation factor